MRFGGEGSFPSSAKMIIKDNIISNVTEYGTSNGYAMKFKYDIDGDFIVNNNILFNNHFPIFITTEGDIEMNNNKLENNDHNVLAQAGKNYTFNNNRIFRNEGSTTVSSGLGVLQAHGNKVINNGKYGPYGLYLTGELDVGNFNICFVFGV